MESHAAEPPPWDSSRPVGSCSNQLLGDGNGNHRAWRHPGAK